MSKTVQWIAASVLGLVCAGGLAWGADLAEVEKSIQDTWMKQKALAAKLRTSTKLEQMGMSMESKGDGSFEFVRKGEKVQVRTEIKIDATQKMGDQESKSSQSMLSIVDGDVTYSLQEFMDQKFAAKSRTEPGSVPEPKQLFEQLRQNHDVALGAEQSVGGRKAYVIEATPKAPMPGDPVRKNVLYFDQDSGFMTKMEALGEEGKVFSTFEYVDLKFDAPIPDERFVFKAPEGVEVVDQTAVAEAPTTAPANPPPTTGPAEKKSDAPPATQPAKP
jgi:outer membrane lipoprotein-sorting protein